MCVSQFQKVQHEYAHLASNYDQRWAEYIAATVEATIDPLAPRPDDRLLDIGCGTGVLLQQVHARWPGVPAVGIDLSGKMLARARQRLGPGTPLVQADASALPFAANSFDVVISNSSLHFWSRPEVALGEIVRVLRPSGRLVITDWCADYVTVRLLGVWLRATGRAQEHTFRDTELRALLEERGFGVAGVRRWKLNWFWGLMTVQAFRNTV